MSRVAVVGSRDFPRLPWVFAFVSSLPEGTIVVSGGARGVDRAAEVCARQRGLEVVSIRPDWSRGRAEGLKRNTRIVEASDYVVAFWDGASTGTADTIRKARTVGNLAVVVTTTTGWYSWWDLKLTGRVAS